mmetsp:Transcript_73905/g.203462  ORF Transcript_73905/g.203462 Transcript_73905/m.203462 type:complete len:336 (+) Transcript_73905:73-1080(+)
MDGRRWRDGVARRRLLRRLARVTHVDYPARVARDQVHAAAQLGLDPTLDHARVRLRAARVAGRLRAGAELRDRTDALCDRHPAGHLCRVHGDARAPPPPPLQGDGPHRWRLREPAAAAGDARRGDPVHHDRHVHLRRRPHLAHLPGHQPGSVHLRRHHVPASHHGPVDGVVWSHRRKGARPGAGDAALPHRRHRHHEPPRAGAELPRLGAAAAALPQRREGAAQGDGAHRHRCCVCDRLAHRARAEQPPGADRLDGAAETDPAPTVGAQRAFGAQGERDARRTRGAPRVGPDDGDAGCQAGREAGEHRAQGAARARRRNGRRADSHGCRPLPQRR